MKKKAKKASRFPDYEKVDLGEITTFGTSVYLREDERAIKILFPCGDIIEFQLCIFGQGVPLPRIHHRGNKIKK